MCAKKPVNRFVKKWVINNLEFKHRCDDVTEEEAKIFKKVRKITGFDPHNLIMDSEKSGVGGEAKDDENVLRILKRRLTEAQACYEKLKREEALRDKVKSPEKRMSKR